MIGGYGKWILLPFIESLFNNTILTSLDISENKLGDKGILKFL